MITKTLSRQDLDIIQIFSIDFLPTKDFWQSDTHSPLVNDHFKCFLGIIFIFHVLATFLLDECEPGYQLIDILS